MIKPWIERSAALGCALLLLSIAHSGIRAQDRGAPAGHRQTSILTLEGPAIRVLATGHLSRRELRSLVTDPRTVRDHPDLAEYYQSKSQRLQAEAEQYQQIAGNFGDPKPLDAPNHFNIGRNARHYHVIARERMNQARSAGLLADLYAQAAQGEGCFKCHKLHGRGGNIAPDLAFEGSRRRSNAWLIGHFKNPRAYSPGSVMPALHGLTNQQLEALASFLQVQKKR